MRSISTFAIAAALVGLASASYAELQNVEVGGQIRIRANYYDFDDSFSGESSWVEQRTRLSVKADFTDEVSMFIELDEWGVWGTAFRDNYFTGIGGASGGADNVDLYQAYIQADQMWGTPLRLRVGRQELSFGSEWLVGTNDTSSFFQGLSFDAARLDYTTDEFGVTAFVSHLAEAASGVGGTGNDGLLDDDVVFTGVYASYTGLEDITIDAYYFGVFDNDQAGTGAIPTAAFAALEGRRQWGVANPGFLALNNTLDRNVEETTIHTIGLRGAGTYGAFDFDAEVAYQFGEVEVHNPFNFLFWDLGKTSDKEYGNIAANVGAGYTFDVSWTPRIGLGFAYFGGAEEETQTFGLPFGGIFDWQEELGFNRLFSNWEYSEFLDNTDLSNAMIFTASLSANPTEAIALNLYAAYFLSNETPEYGWGWDLFNDTDDSIGFELGLYGEYSYTEDLIFRSGVAGFWAGDGVNYGNRPGNALNGNGIFPSGVADDDETMFYVFLETELKF
jgi:hypothetical protein